MFYVKLDSDGTLSRYPYTLADLRLENKGTSWPKTISDEVAAGFGVYPVTPAPQPAERYDITIERTAIQQGEGWVEQWIETPVSTTELARRTSVKAAEIREDRTRRLAECDWTQLPDAPVDAAEWAAYRQALRDISDQAGFPWDVQWPVAPGTVLIRARNADGTFKADDPATPDVNEAWVPTP
jgi:hypothetical protein